jgi:hypothetical protein
MDRNLSWRGAELGAQSRIAHSALTPYFMPKEWWKPLVEQI